MTAFEKLAVSLPLQAAQSVRRAVRRGRAMSVSAYIAEAIEEKAKLDELAILLDEMLAASGGPLTATERRAADRALGIPTKKSPRKAR
jgi:Arc/MetJ-type ribon-helix-helix transcriptional regulator